MSQQKDSDPEEYKRLHTEREAHVKRIQLLTEENNKLKAEIARFVCLLFTLFLHFLHSSIHLIFNSSVQGQQYDNIFARPDSEYTR